MSLLGINMTILIISALNVITRDFEVQKFYIGGIIASVISIMYQVKRLFWKDENIISEFPRLFVISWGIYGIVNISQLHNEVSAIILLMIAGFLNLFKMEYPIGQNSELRV